MEANAVVKIVMTGHGKGEVFVNGEKVPMVSSVEISAVAGACNQVRIELVPDQIEVSGVFDVTTIESEAAELKRGDV